MPRKVLLMLAMPLVLHAAGWESVQSLSVNTKTRVIRKSGDAKGSFVSATSETIVIRDSSGEVSIPRSDVKRVKVLDPSRRIRNGLIGTAIGAAAGIGIGFGVCPGCANEGHGGKYVGPGAAIGIGVGAAAGFLPAAYRTVYKAPK